MSKWIAGLLIIAATAGAAERRSQDEESARAMRSTQWTEEWLRISVRAVAHRP